MPRRPLLDSRYFRMDDILRRSYQNSTQFSPSGTNVWAASPQGWGFQGGVHYNIGEELRPFTLTVFADGKEVVPVDGVDRPSHVTLNGVDSDTGLQVTEDKFITSDDVVVSVLSFRNPSEYAVSLEIGLKWGVRAGEREVSAEQTVFIGRDAPPPDDRRITMASGARHLMIFALAFAPDSETAEQRVWKWTGDMNAVLTQATNYQRWFDERIPRFDCPDPWLTKLWYYHWYVIRRTNPVTVSAVETRWLTGDIVSGTEDSGLWQELQLQDVPDRMQSLQRIVQGQFDQGDYNQLSYYGLSKPIIDMVITSMLGLLPSSDGSLHLRPLIATTGEGSWPYFCLERLRYQGHQLTFIWDSLENPEDYCDDGDKGFTIYDGDTILHHQADLSPLSIALRRSREDSEDEEE